MFATLSLDLSHLSLHFSSLFPFSLTFYSLLCGKMEVGFSLVFVNLLTAVSFIIIFGEQ